MSAQQTVAFLSANGLLSDPLPIRKSIGIGPLRIVYFWHMFPIALSTWMRTLAIFLVSIISGKESCIFPRRNAGIPKIHGK